MRERTGEELQFLEISLIVTPPKKGATGFLSTYQNLSTEISNMVIGLFLFKI